MAGLAGLFEVAGPIGQLLPSMSPGYGFTAIIVAFLGRLHPVGVLFASLIMALSYLGGEAAQIDLNLPVAVTSVFQGLLLFFLLACDVLIHYRIGRGRSHERGRRMSDVAVLALLTIITSATPLVYAAIGELVTERSGVLNLGVEGMMLAGAVCGFAMAHVSGSATLGLLAGLTAGMLMALLFAALTLTLKASQVATGLALTLFGIGLSALLGQSLIGLSYAGLPTLPIPLLGDLPIIGRLLFRHDILVYGSFALVAGVAWFLNRTRAGLVLRAVGDSHDVAHALGYHVIRIRYLACLFGGACSGLGGAYLSMEYAPMWVENMTAGRGWIALALVVFATWQPGRLLAGAYLFGWHQYPAAARAGSGHQRALAAHVDATLRDDDHRAGADLA